jgi:hypothetical protein
MVHSDGSRRVKLSVYFQADRPADLEQAGDGQIDPRHYGPPGVKGQRAAQAETRLAGWPDGSGPGPGRSYLPTSRSQFNFACWSCKSRITQLEREGSPQPGLRLPQAELSLNSSQVLQRLTQGKTYRRRSFPFIVWRWAEMAALLTFGFPERVISNGCWLDPVSRRTRQRAALRRRRDGRHGHRSKSARCGSSPWPAPGTRLRRTGVFRLTTAGSAGDRSLKVAQTVGIRRTARPLGHLQQAGALVDKLLMCEGHHRTSPKHLACRTGMTRMVDEVRQ